MALPPPLVRRLGELVETVHAVVYFAPEPLAAYEEIGLRGFWRGYFASRAAALGPVGPEIVTRLFGGFAPEMVARAVPAVWGIASPELVLAARLAGVTAALERLLPGAYLEPVLALTRPLVESLPRTGHPLAEAQADLPRPTEAAAAVWHDLTVLREFRGDAHLEAVRRAGLTWPEPHLLAAGRLDPRQQAVRGWDDETWARAAKAVEGVDAEALEETTDELTAPAFAALEEPERLADLLAPLARACSADLFYPNPIGVARP